MSTEKASPQPGKGCGDAHPAWSDKRKSIADENLMVLGQTAAVLFGQVQMQHAVLIRRLHVRMHDPSCRTAPGWPEQTAYAAHPSSRQTGSLPTYSASTSAIPSFIYCFMLSLSVGVEVVDGVLSHCSRDAMT